MAENQVAAHDCAMNPRFFGAWLLESFESRAADGGVSRPWGDDPVGIIYWDDSGYFAVQLGPRQTNAGAGYLSFFGKAEASAPGEESGVITLRVTGGSAPERVNGDQVRNFLFLEPGLLRMRPPVGPDGSQSTFLWRRAVAG